MPCFTHGSGAYLFQQGYYRVGDSRRNEWLMAYGNRKAEWMHERSGETEVVR